MAKKETFRIEFDRAGYTKLAGLGDVSASVAQLAILESAKNIRDKMAEHIAENSYKTAYGDAMSEVGLDVGRRTYHFEEGMGSYESITRSIVVHAKPRISSTGRIYTTIGAKTRGSGASVGVGDNKKSASDALAELDSGVSYSATKYYRFELDDKRAPISDRDEGSQDGHWTTKGFKGKHFMKAGSEFANSEYGKANVKIAGMLKSITEMYVKEKGYKKAGNFVASAFRKALDKGVEEK